MFWKPANSATRADFSHALLALAIFALLLPTILCAQRTVIYGTVTGPAGAKVTATNQPPTRAETSPLRFAWSVLPMR